MANIEDFDILYMMKSPFYLGDFEKAISEANQLEINADDSKNQNLKNLFVVRALTAKSDMQGLKSFITALLKDQSK